MSPILVIALYALGLAEVVLAAHAVSVQYQQPWIYHAAIGAACLVTARYVARGIS